MSEVSRDERTLSVHLFCRFSLYLNQNARQYLSSDFLDIRRRVVGGRYEFREKSAQINKLFKFEDTVSSVWYPKFLVQVIENLPHNHGVCFTVSERRARHSALQYASKTGWCHEFKRSSLDTATTQSVIHGMSLMEDTDPAPTSKRDETVSRSDWFGADMLDSGLPEEVFNCVRVLFQSLGWIEDSKGGLRKCINERNETRNTNLLSSELVDLVGMKIELKKTHVYSITGTSKRSKVFASSIKRAASIHTRDNGPTRILLRYKKHEWGCAL